MARKGGLTPEQIARMEENRRQALALKRGLKPDQLAGMEVNRRRALEHKEKKTAGNVEVVSKPMVEEVEVQWLVAEKIGAVNFFMYTTARPMKAHHE